MFLFFDFPNSTLGELAGARVGSQGKQRTGPRPCNNIKVLIQRKNMKKVNKKYQTKSASQVLDPSIFIRIAECIFYITESHEDKPKENCKQVDGPPIFNKIIIMFFSLKSHSCFFPIKYSFIIGKETNLQAHMAPFLTSAGSEMLVMS